MAPAPVEIFLSYSHKDESLCRQLEGHLAVLSREVRISTWHDRRLEAGAEWEPELRKHLEAAQVVVLLVSSDFLKSQFCRAVEMEAALARHEAGTAKVIPVILRPCDWRSTPLQNLQALPKDGLAIRKWANKDEAFLDVVEGLRRVVDGLQRERQEVPPPADPEPPDPEEESVRLSSFDEERVPRFRRRYSRRLAAFRRALPSLLFIVILAGAGGVIWLLVRGAGTPPAPTPPAGAVLRLELGVHSAPIRRIAVDRDERYLVTGSDDRTVRVWDLEGGDLLQVLRPPLGSGDESRIHAVAIHPAGSLIAASGFDSQSRDKHSIYLFDRATGQLLPSIGGLAHLVRGLAFSPDGSRIAAALRGGGVGVFSSSGGETLFSDFPGEDCYAVAYGADSRLALACAGFLKIYPPEIGGFSWKTALTGGGHPDDVVLAPGGGQLAVSYGDSTSIEIFSVTDIESLVRRIDDSVLTGPLAVAWSPDRRIFVGGCPRQVGKSPVYSLPESGTGQGWLELPGPADTVLDLLALRGGRLVYGAADPAWALVSADGRKRPEKGPAQAIFSGGMGDGLSTGSEGTVVAFRFAPGGREVIFDLPRRRYGLDAKTPLLAPPRTLAPGLMVEGWLGETGPRIHGVALDLPPGEIARCLAIAPDGESFLLGTENGLQSYRKDGRPSWRTPGPGVAWAVNLSGNGKFALAAFGDGTIRWFDAENGKELLAFFPHSDGTRWVLWTPSGYYDASPGGEELIGWQVYRGTDQKVDFYPAASFRDHFHRPQVIDRILETLDEAEAVRLAG